MTLVEFLLARIAEDEAAARTRFVSHRMINGRMVDIPVTTRSGAWAWSPDRVLAECEAKRRVIEALGSACDENFRTELALQALALPYADHLDYQKAWRA